MKQQNAAVAIREALGCYNIMMHNVPAAPKRKTVSYGANLKAHFDKKNAQRLFARLTRRADRAAA